MMTSLTCWQCGVALNDLPLPLSRNAECPRCRAALRVCRLCEFYDQRANRQCREPQAELVREKERANFCDWFRPLSREQVRTDEAAARAGLDALFTGRAEAGNFPSNKKAVRQALDDLFGKK